MVRLQIDDVHSLSYRRIAVGSHRATVIEGHDTAGRRFRIVLRHDGALVRRRVSAAAAKPKRTS